ncbi:hypothetical protein LCGC14_1890570, partial [marine sediment metagenome]
MICSGRKREDELCPRLCLKSETYMCGLE